MIWILVTGMTPFVIIGFETTAAEIASTKITWKGDHRMFKALQDFRMAVSWFQFSFLSAAQRCCTDMGERELE